MLNRYNTTTLNQQKKYMQQTRLSNVCKLVVSRSLTFRNLPSVCARARKCQVESTQHIDAYECQTRMVIRARNANPSITITQ